MSVDRLPATTTTGRAPDEAPVRSASGRLAEPIRLLAPLLLLVGAAVLCFHRLGAQSLWLDEGYAANYVATSYLGRLIADLWSPTQAYPLYHLILKLTTRLLGDSEWALRLPSALAGALAVPAIYALGVELRDRWLGGCAALLLMASPFALWQAQDAKAYSLTLLVTTLLLWSLFRALRLHTRRAWLVWIVCAVLGPLVHRLTLLPLLGCVAAIVVDWPGRSGRWRAIGLGAVALAAVALALGIGRSLQQQGATGQFIPAGPVQALALTFTKFALDRYGCGSNGQCDLAWFWFVPFGGLLLLGVGWAVWSMLRGGAVARRSVLLVLACGGVPAAIFLILFTLQPLYEPRYLTVLFPIWLLVLANGIATPLAALSRRRWPAAVLGLLLFVWIAISDRTALVQPGRGLWSGAAVKEDYRGALTTLAAHVHPDDLVIVHPDAIKPLYTYYARRVAPQPLPEPHTYPQLGRAQGYSLRELDIAIRADLHRAARAWLVIAPDHARLVDPPNRQVGDDLGLVGLAFQYGDRNGRIMCGNPEGYRFNGVRVYCNNIPDVAGVVPQPQQPALADFGGQLRLHGSTLKPWSGGFHPGATLPVSLFWEPLVSLAGTDDQIFIHLTKPDDPTVLAQVDGRPMEGGQPTSRWTQPHALLHDDRAIPLPSSLLPGHYVLRVGVYSLAAGAPRLPVSNTTLPTHDNSVIISDVEITGVGR